MVTANVTRTENVLCWRSLFSTKKSVNLGIGPQHVVGQTVGFNFFKLAPSTLTGYSTSLETYLRFLSETQRFLRLISEADRQVSEGNP
jgi:hypothetical protein